MKAQQPKASFLIARAMGRTEADLTKRDQAEQLELFREVLTRPAKVQVLAMMALSDPRHLDRAQSAKVADIARAMGYAPLKRADGKRAFHPDTYKQIEDTGLNLRRKSFDLFFREPTGKTKDGRRQYRDGLVNLSILQEFGFQYEDETGEPIDLEARDKKELIQYQPVADAGKALYAIPMINSRGHFIKNKDGSIRRRPANGVTWTFASRFAKLSQDKETAWVFYSEAVAILTRYLTRPASFDLIWLTLFWKGEAPSIEMGHDKLVGHLNIRAKDTKQVQAAIDAAFADALKEGIIDRPVTIRPPAYYKPTPKTGKPRRKDMVYQWQRAAKWNPGKKLISISADDLEPSYSDQDGKTERPKA
jgi:hypothetical protein